MGAILKKTKVALAFFSAFWLQHSPAQENEKPDQVRIIGHYENAVGTSDAASQGTITPQLIETRPMLRPGEVLEYVPGVIITQHSGDGKANQYFLRGFNLDHGTDFLTTIDHMPVNLPTHAHGQGYSDINFLLPELVSRIAYKKGPYFAEEGDFSSAGVADIDYYTKMPKGIASLGLGSNGYRREKVAGFLMYVYAIKYRLNLFSNFTYFLNKPTIGDQFEQADERTVVGLTPRWVFTENWGERQMTHKLGVDARRDDINVALYDT